ncbi:MAG: iron-sulfur cluster insertion protein ErpA [bacterium]
MDNLTTVAAPSVSVSAKAAEEIKRVIEEQKMQGMSLRLRVVPGGCSGFSYYMGFDDTTEPNDQAFESQGVKVLVDTESLKYLAGSEVDYVDGLMGAGFTVRNPNAKSSCGCGTSFTT